MPEKEKKIAGSYLDVPLFKHPPVFAYSIALSKSLFGDTIDASRYVPIVFRILTVLVVFLLSKEFFGQVWALFAAFIMSIEPVFMFSSQKIWMEVPCSFFAYLAIALLFLGRGKKIPLIASAVALGLALLTKYTAVLFVFPVYVMILISSYVKDRRNAVLYVLTPLIVFAPWIIWNVCVYGPGFFSKIIRMNSSIIEGEGASFGFARAAVWLVATGGIGLVIYMIRCFRSGKNPMDHPLIVDNTEKIKEMISFGARLCVISLFVLSITHILRSLSWGYFPERSSSMHLYDESPKYFYFYHFVELFPIYLFSYLSVFFLRRKRVELLFFAVLTFIIFFFFGFFGYYESRYATLAIPGMVILAVFTLKEIFEMIMGFPENSKDLSLVLLGFIVAFCVFKTLYFDLAIVMKNDFIFF